MKKETFRQQCIRLNETISEKKPTTDFNTIELYDVVYACIDAEVSNG